MFLFSQKSRSPSIIPVVVPVTDPLRPRGETSQILFRKIIKRYFGLTLSLSSLHHIWEEKEARLLSWGSFLLLLRVLDLCYALGEGGVTTITAGRKCQRGISEGEFHHIYMRGRRIPIVVVGVASPSFPCARHFGVMHSGTKWGATITESRIYTPHELRVFKKRLDRPIVNPWWIIMI